LAGNTWGSGVLIGRSLIPQQEPVGNSFESRQQNQWVYTVLTNHHVLQGRGAYQVQAPDGRIYVALADSEANFGRHDLALLQFTTTDAIYPLATFGRGEGMTVGNTIFAAGFPIATQSTPTDLEMRLESTQEGGFKFTRGQVVFISDKVLEGGYQLGYSNEIEKGMSGGPVLNQHGEVIAINGMHAYPLWGDPYIFSDGSRPCVALQQLMTRSSWAIPTETFMLALVTAPPTPVQTLPPLSPPDSGSSSTPFSTGVAVAEFCQSADSQ
jgi:S1-C subfamily serine protease